MKHCTIENANDFKLLPIGDFTAVKYNVIAKYLKFEMSVCIIVLKASF
jgi:hypothetical protein